MGLRWVTDPTPYLDSLTSVPAVFAEELVQRYTAEVGPAMQQYAVANHPWRNLTGALEASIHFIVEWDTSASKIIVGVGYDGSAASKEGFDYGSHLETTQAGRFAILRPTVIQFLPQIFAAADNIKLRATT